MNRFKNNNINSKISLLFSTYWMHKLITLSMGLFLFMFIAVNSAISTEAVKEYEKSYDIIPIKIDKAVDCKKESRQKEHRQEVCEISESNSESNIVEKLDTIYTPKKLVIPGPNPDNFGKYYDYAMQIYDYIMQGKNVEEFVFESETEFKDFNHNINLILSNNSVPEINTIKYSYINHSSSRISAKPLLIGHQEYVDYVLLEDLIISICGKENNVNEIIDNLNKWLIDNTVYDYSHKNISYDSIGILYNRAAVCNGFSRFVKLACDIYDIPCVIVEGSVNSGNSHAWNQVQIGNNWYNIDSTWNVCNRTNKYNLSKKLWDDHYI